jgi:hypothetical protein
MVLLKAALESWAKFVPKAFLCQIDYLLEVSKWFHRSELHFLEAVVKKSNRAKFNFHTLPGYCIKHLFLLYIVYAFMATIRFLLKYISGFSWAIWYFNSVLAGQKNIRHRFSQSSVHILITWSSASVWNTYLHCCGTGTVWTVTVP